jgi:hypothetical protein
MSLFIFFETKKVDVIRNFYPMDKIVKMSKI